MEMTAKRRAEAVQRDLEARGFVLEVDDGRLWVRPAEHITDADRAAIRACRDALYALVQPLDASPIDAGHERQRQHEPGGGEILQASWPPIPCTECGQPAIRDGRHLCVPCLAAWRPGVERGNASGALIGA